MSRFDPPRDPPAIGHGCVPTILIVVTIAIGYQVHRVSGSILIGIAAGVVSFLLALVVMGWSNS